MQNFHEWLTHKHPEYFDEGIFDAAKNLGKKAAIGAALVGGGIMANNYTQNQATPTNNYQLDGDSHWNSEIGKYTVLNQGGKTIYQRDKGNFVRVPSKFSPNGFKFIQV